MRGFLALSRVLEHPESVIEQGFGPQGVDDGTGDEGEGKDDSVLELVSHEAVSCGSAWRGCQAGLYLYPYIIARFILKSQ